MLESNQIAPNGQPNDRGAPAAHHDSSRIRKHSPQPANAEPPPQYESEKLLAGGEEALIMHRDEVYRLRRTWTGKLILTK